MIFERLQSGTPREVGNVHKMVSASPTARTETNTRKAETAKGNALFGRLSHLQAPGGPAR